MSAEFPRRFLEIAADERLCETDDDRFQASIFRQAIKAYDELAERCVMDRAKMSAEIGNLRRENTELNAAIDETLARVDLLRRLSKGEPDAAA